MSRNPDKNNNRNSHSISDGDHEPIAITKNFNECSACTQVGVPVFHSIRSDCNLRRPSWGPFGRVSDPRSKRVLRWNRAVLLARGMALALDPLFFYTISLSPSGAPCFYINVALAAILTVVRTCVDLVHLCHLLLQLRLAYVSTESLVVGCGKLVWDARAIASHNLRSLKGFWLDAFVILPVPQVVTWLVVPKLLKEEGIKLIMTILLVTYLFQFLPKLYHSIYLLRKLQKVTGYIFGSDWWRLHLNLLAYFIASHVAGGCWYALSTQRLVSCLQQQYSCDRPRINNYSCNLSLFCSEGIGTCLYNQSPATTINRSLCLDVDGPFNFGIYSEALPVFSSNSLALTILYPIYWGFLNLSTFGNVLEPSSNWLELIVSICITLAGLALFITLVGNIQIILHTVTATKKEMQLRYRDMERWMKRRQLPSHLRRRVRHFERLRGAAMGGLDEMELIRDLPDGLRRDIKRYLCIDLVKKVPLFQVLDDLILDNICDMVTPLFFSRGERIIREGDPVHRMIFIVNGRLNRRQALGKGFVTTSTVLEAGSFLGEDLLSWCLHQTFIDRLPSSPATFVCLESVEAYGLDACNLRFITEHFRYKFSSDGLIKRTMRYYSSNWRTWGAVIIQFAWRRYRIRTR
ncbi:hypothetical protein F2P56_025727 [Juglans regia]|uniref:Cyclic nucleotide-binding domain-containing protein n=2 Tax=Juglans regia TaxID=51240 RepID=A0A833UKL7_JUGRE|nr:cyclic nucleotide-gated ion channel 2-like [Juglans regia]KAF5456223.1 hypothetical protein F2P56_025727 [Juglans regia]